MITFVIPTYNESGNITRLINSICAEFKGSDIEFIVIDDGSTDATVTEIKRLIDSGQPVRLIERPCLMGLTSAIQLGINESKGEIIVRPDADGSMTARTMKELADLTESGYDLVFASRYVPGGSDKRGTPLAVTLSIFINLFCRILLTFKYKDYTSCLFAAKRSKLKEINLTGDYGEFFIHLLFSAYKKGWRIKEHPYTLHPRIEGISKTAVNLNGFMKRGTKYVKMTIQLAFNKINE